MEQLLSSTHGLSDDGACARQKMSTTYCAEIIQEGGNHSAPGSTFDPSPVGFILAVETIVGSRSWTNIFDQFKTAWSNSPSTGYPTTANVAETKSGDHKGIKTYEYGALTASPEEYARFLSAMLRGQLLSKVMRQRQWADYTPWKIDRDPVRDEPPDRAGEWHAGLGVWLQCDSRPWSNESCGGDDSIVSGASATGFFPWIDRANGIYGLLARPTTTKRSAVTDRAAELFVVIGHNSEHLRWHTHTCIYQSCWHHRAHIPASWGCFDSVLPLPGQQSREQTTLVID